MGLPLKSLQGFRVPAESYDFANKRLAWETISPLLDRSIRPVAAAIADAVFDATSGRPRHAPLTPDQLGPALA